VGVKKNQAPEVHFGTSWRAQKQRSALVDRLRRSHWHAPIFFRLRRATPTTTQWLRHSGGHQHGSLLLSFLFFSFLFFSFPSLSQFKVPSLLFEFQSVYINNKTIIRELAILAARKSIRLLRLAFAHNYLPALRGVGVLDGRIKA
jgi:hypothetical protein